MKIDKPSPLDLGTREESLIGAKAEANAPHSAERIADEKMTETDTPFLRALSSLGSAASIPEPLDPFCRLLLSADAREDELSLAVRRLDEASASLLRPNGKGGAIYEYEKKLSSLEKEIADSDRAAQSAAALADELCRAERKKAEANAELEKLLDLESAYGNLSLIREYDELHTLENALDDEKNAYDAFLAAHRVGAFLPNEAYGEELSRHFLTVSDSVRAYANARKAFQALDTHEEQDFKYEEHLETVQRKYGSFDAVRRASRLLARRGAHTAVFSFLALFTSAFFFVCTMLSYAENARLALVLVSLALCALVSAPVLLISRRRFANALLILCREFGAKDRSSLLKRLRFLEEERARRDARSKDRALAKERLDRATRECTEALERLNALSTQWGRTISPARANGDLEILLTDVRTFLERDRTYRMRIEEKEREVTLARKSLSTRNEIAVRALVSPAKRQNLRLLEKENRLSEIAQGVALYQRASARLESRIAELQREHAALCAKIGTPDTLRLERDALSARINDLRALYLSYALIRRALCERIGKKAWEAQPYQRYREALGGEACATQADSLAYHLALAAILLPEGTPLAVKADGIKEEVLTHLAHVAKEENRPLCIERAKNEPEEKNPEN